MPELRKLVPAYLALMARTPLSSFPHWILRRGEQTTVAILVAAGIVAVLGWWLFRGGISGRTVEIEKAAPQTAQFQVDINQAPWPEFATLPGVGRNLAERIVQTREQSGPFADVDDLRRVRGIGPHTLESIRPYLRPMPGRRAVAGR
jgi:competence ComEA-like helix-hairpin-helix protein